MPATADESPANAVKENHFGAFQAIPRALPAPNTANTHPTVKYSAVILDAIVGIGFLAKELVSQTTIQFKDYRLVRIPRAAGSLWHKRRLSIWPIQNYVFGFFLNDDPGSDHQHQRIGCRFFLTRRFVFASEIEQHPISIAIGEFARSVRSNNYAADDDRPAIWHLDTGSRCRLQFLGNPINHDSRGLNEDRNQSYGDEQMPQVKL